MAENKTVSIIVRTIDGRFDPLERAVFSIYCNDYVHKQVVLVYQGTDKEYFSKLHTLAEIYRELDFKFVQNPTARDERARNLNLGMKSSDGRFICFLDDDDAVYPNHLSSLVNAVIDAGKSWSYSQVCIDIEERGYVVKKDYKFNHAQFSYLKLWANNYIPINTLLIDTHGIEDKALLYFDESMNKNEDYAFLIKLGFYYEPAVCQNVTCIYKIRTDGSNTIMHSLEKDDPEYEQRNIEWERAAAKVEEVRERLAAKAYWIRETMDLKGDTENKSNRILRMSARIGSNKRLRIILERTDRKKKKRTTRSVISYYLFKRTGLNNIEIFLRKKIFNPIKYSIFHRLGGCTDEAFLKPTSPKKS